jgi:hypothetical protein
MKIKNTETGKFGHISVESVEIPKVMVRADMMALTYEDALAILKEDSENE